MREALRRIRELLSLLAWKLRGRKFVRLHLSGAEPSIEGILAGTPAGHYRLLKATLHERVDESGTSIGETFVPANRVLFLQVIR